MLMQDARYVIDDELDSKIDEMRKYDFFLICQKCWYVWDRSGFDYEKAEFADPKVCPCCNNDWTTGFTIAGKAPNADKGDPLVWVPLTDKIVPSQDKWIEFQQEKRTSKKNPLLVVKLEEFKANKARYIKERDDFIQKLKDKNIDITVVFKMIG